MPAGAPGIGHVHEVDIVRGRLGCLARPTCVSDFGLGRGGSGEARAGGGPTRARVVVVCADRRERRGEERGGTCTGARVRRRDQMDISVECRAEGIVERVADAGSYARHVVGHVHGVARTDRQTSKQDGRRGSSAGERPEEKKNPSFSFSHTVRRWD